MLTDKSNTVVSSFNRFCISSVKELTMHFKCPDISYHPFDESKPVFIIRDISVPEVLKIITSLKSYKAKDEFAADKYFLKLHKETLASPVVHLTNLPIKQGEVPTTWKTSKVTLVFKAGDKMKPGNYQPVSIFPIILKMAEKWAAMQLTDYLNNCHAPQPSAFWNITPLKQPPVTFLRTLKVN